MTYTRSDGLLVQIRVLNPDDILDHENFAEHERYLFICSTMEELKKVKIIWAKIAIARRGHCTLSPIAAGLLTAAEIPDAFFDASELMCKMFSWKGPILSAQLNIEDALLVLYDDIKAPLWTLAKHWLRSYLFFFDDDTPRPCHSAQTKIENTLLATSSTKALEEVRLRLEETESLTASVERPPSAHLPRYRSRG